MIRKAGVIEQKRQNSLLHKVLMRGSLISQLTNGALRCQRSLTALLRLPFNAGSKLCCIVSRAYAARAISELIWELNNSLYPPCRICCRLRFKCTSDYECNINPPYQIRGENRCINFRKEADIRFFTGLCPSLSDFVIEGA